MSLSSTKPTQSRQPRNSSPATKISTARHHPSQSQTPGLLKLPSSHGSHGSSAPTSAPGESPNRRSRPRRTPASATPTPTRSDADDDRPSHSTTNPTPNLMTPPRALPLPSPSPSHSPSPVKAKQRRGRSARQHSPPLEPFVPASTARQDSSADEWDMPSVLPGAKPAGLTWQQLEAAPTPRLARTESATPRKAAPTLARPILSGSLSDSASAPRASLSGLTWQQELLNSPAAPSPTTSYGSAPTSNTSTQKARRNQLRDEMTFGVSALSLDDDSPAPSSAPVQRRTTQPILVQTPTKVARYAGAEFQNSPSPASLPKPSFLLRRTPVALARD